MSSVMSDGLRGRVAVITGGATGIGRAVARGLISRGAHVMIAGRHSERGYHVARSLSGGAGRATFERADVRCEQDVERLFQRTLQIYGRIDFLFNNAGSEGPHGSGEAVPGDHDLDELLGTNIKGVMLCLRHALPRLAACGGGVVVNTGSFVGTTLPFPEAVAYGATKAAVLSITRSVAAASKAQNVVVLAVCPWITDTPMVDRLAGRDDAAKAEFARVNPSGRIVRPDEVARVVLAMFAGTSGLESGEAVLVDSGGAMQAIVPMTPGPILQAEACNTMS
jgi:NAD(P)-dependent dehydrogenase (short-subunit alcohol dehydrogenase family)